MRDIDQSRGADLWDFYPGDEADLENDTEWFDWWSSRRTSMWGLPRAAADDAADPTGFWGEAETWTSAKRKRPIIG